MSKWQEWVFWVVMGVLLVAAFGLMFGLAFGAMSRPDCTQTTKIVNGTTTEQTVTCYGVQP